MESEADVKSVIVSQSDLVPPSLPPPSICCVVETGVSRPIECIDYTPVAVVNAAVGDGKVVVEREGEEAMGGEPQMVKLVEVFATLDILTDDASDDDSDEDSDGSCCGSWVESIGYRQVVGESGGDGRAVVESYEGVEATTGEPDMVEAFAALDIGSDEASDEDDEGEVSYCEGEEEEEEEDEEEADDWDEEEEEEDGEYEDEADYYDDEDYDYDEPEYRGMSIDAIERITATRFLVDETDIEDSILECPICIDEFSLGVAAIRLPCVCLRAFHEGCIVAWLEKQDSCPLCRATLTI